MAARIVLVDPHDPAQQAIADAVAVLRDGAVVALPTETLYGLATDPFRGDCLARLNALKGKGADAAVLLLLADTLQLGQVAREIPRTVFDLAEVFWPGPLTLVLVRRPELPAEIAPGRQTVAARVPGLELPRAIAAALGRPISGVSANRHGEAPARTADEVMRTLPEGIDLVLDGGRTPGEAPSTLLDLTGARPRVLRAGAVPVERLRQVVPEVEEL